MLYGWYQYQDDCMAPIRGAAAVMRWAMPGGVWGFWDPRSHLAAALEMVSRYRLSHARPDFGIRSARVGQRTVAVTEEVVVDLPFGRLLRFTKDTSVAQPRVLIVAPLSGHFATLLRGTVETMLENHDVFITDWANARDVPLDDGAFGVDDYVAYLIRFLEAMGPGAHVLAVCQPCVQVLAAVAVMSQEGHAATPRSMILMAGPIDPRENPTTVNEFAEQQSIAWLDRNVISTVPARHRGGGRRVYPGFIQSTSFMMMNVGRHAAAHVRMYSHLVAGEDAAAEKLKHFYDEYFAVLDLTAEFYLETVDRVFQRAEIARGEYTYRGRPVDPGLIRNTALLTIEGGRDDICAVGQTAAAHELCCSLRPHLKRHHLQANVGHYGTFSGRRWECEIYPVIQHFILAME